MRRLEKEELRQTVINKIKKFTDEEKHTYEMQMQDHMVNSDIWRQVKVLGITVSQGFEWDTKKIIEKAWEEGKQVCVPKCLPKHKEMVFYEITSFDQLEVVYYNLLEPIPVETNKVDKNSIDLLVVPGIVFNPDGYRIGFGGGYYDRFLTDFRNDTMSMLHSVQLLPKLPIEAHDIPVKHLLTENGII